MPCVRTVLWLKGNAEPSHLGSNHMLCVWHVYVGDRGLLENGKSDKHIELPQNVAADRDTVTAPQR